MNKEKQLEELLKVAKQIKMSKEDQERHPLITQDMIDQAANLINQNKIHRL